MDKPSISTEMGLRCGLSMQSLALRIDEWRLDPLGVDDFPQVMDAYLLTQPLGSPRQHAEGDRALELRTPIAGSHMTFGLRRRCGGRDLRAHRQQSTPVQGAERHQLKSIGV